MSEELKISVQTGGWFRELFGGNENADAAFAFIRECGIDTLDFGMDDTLPGTLLWAGKHNDYYDADIDALLEEYRPVKEALKKNGVSLGQAHAPFPLHTYGMDEHNEYMLMMMDKLCAILNYLDCPAVVAHPYTGKSREIEHEINLKMYRAMMPIARKYNIKICLENMFLWTNDRGRVGACGEAQDACFYLDTLNAEAGEALFGYCFDVGHANLSGRTIKDEILTLGPRLTHLHIQDNDGHHDTHHLPYTQRYQSPSWSQLNCTDWDGFLAGLKAVHYRGNLNFEAGPAWSNMPRELTGEFLKLAAAIGRYFRSQLL